MTKQTTVITLTTLMAAALSLPLMMAPAQASTTSMLANCKANSKQKVIACCEKTLLDHKRPYWMSKGQNACASAVVCSKSTKKSFSYALAPALVCQVYVPQGGQGTSTQGFVQ